MCHSIKIVLYSSDCNTYKSLACPTCQLLSSAQQASILFSINTLPHYFLHHFRSTLFNYTTPQNFHSKRIATMLSLTLSNLALMSSVFCSALGAMVPRMLGPNDLILWNNEGEMAVVNKDEYFANNTLEATQVSHSTLPAPAESPKNETAPNDRKRCEKNTIITMSPEQKFLNWDVAMSSVVKAGTLTTLVAVTEGYSISDSLSVSAGAIITPVKDFLQLTLTLTYTTTWTSTMAAAYTYGVPPGMYGVVVSNPLVRRVSGFVDTGCIGASTRSTFQGDSYSSKAYGGLSWVDGTISLCTSATYPVPMCLGGGTTS